MGLVYFSLIGIIVLQTYCIYGNRQWKKRYKEQLPVFRLIESSKDVIYQFEIKPKLRFKYISPSLDHFLGRGTIAESLKNPKLPFDIIHPDDYETLCKKVNGQLDYSQTIVQRWKDENGNYRWFEEYTTPIFDNGEFMGVQGIMRNIDAKIQLQEELHYRVTHDALTDIYNRFYFDKKMDELNEKENLSVSIILCDLDELKYVNDHFGHHEGDLLIKETARLLNTFSSDIVTVAKIGGDEFVILISDMTKEQTEDLVQSILEELKNYNEGGSERKIKLSMGFAYTESSKGCMNELFTQADKNMYKDKINRKKDVHLVKMTN